MDLLLDLFEVFELSAFELSALLKMLLASVCGAAIGIERGMRGRPAGLKTFSLVCLGATMIMITNEYIFHYVSHGTGDIVRMPAQVVSGIGFLGAGSIMVTSHNRVQGLTTAAALWVTAALGLAIGAGFYFGGIGGLCVVLISSFVYKSIDREIVARSKNMIIYVEGKNEEFLPKLIDYFHQNQVRVVSLKRKSETKWYTEDACITLHVEFSKRTHHRVVLDQVRKIEGIRYAEEM